MTGKAAAEAKVCTYEVVRPFWDGKQKILPRKGANSRVRLPEGTQPRGAILIEDETPEPAPTTAQEPAKEPVVPNSPPVLGAAATAKK
jgi:hypothetical protein